MLNRIATGLLCSAGTTNVDSLNPRVLWSLNLEPGSAGCIVTILDGATGVELDELVGAANGVSQIMHYPRGLNCPHGIRVTVTGTGAKAHITYF